MILCNLDILMLVVRYKEDTTFLVVKELTMGQREMHPANKAMVLEQDGFRGVWALYVRFVGGDVKRHANFLNNGLVFARSTAAPEELSGTLRSLDRHTHESMIFSGSGGGRLWCSYYAESQAGLFATTINSHACPPTSWASCSCTCQPAKHAL